MSLDLRFALRQLRRNPAFTLAATLTLALGVAATTTVFSFVDAVLLRPLPYPEPSRLFVLWSARPGTDRETLSYPNFLDYRTRAGDFESMALYRRRRFNVTAGGEPERVRGAARNRRLPSSSPHHTGARSRFRRGRRPAGPGSGRDRERALLAPPAGRRRWRDRSGAAGGRRRLWTSSAWFRIGWLTPPRPRSGCRSRTRPDG